jgi:hypothetical protein
MSFVSCCTLVPLAQLPPSQSHPYVNNAKNVDEKGRKPVSAEVLREARWLVRRSPKTGGARSLRPIATEVLQQHQVVPSGPLLLHPPLSHFG